MQVQRYIPFSNIDIYIQFDVAEEQSKKIKQKKPNNDGCKFWVKSKMRQWKYYTVKHIEVYSGLDDETLKYIPPHNRKVFTSGEIANILLKIPQPRYIVTNSRPTTDILQQLIIAHTNVKLWNSHSSNSKIIIWEFLNLKNTNAIHIFHQAIAYNINKKQQQQRYVKPPEINYRRKHVKIPPVGNNIYIYPTIYIEMSFPVPDNFGDDLTKKYNDCIEQSIANNE